MADMSFSLGLNADDLVRGTVKASSALENMNRSAASMGRKLLEQRVLLKGGEGALSAYRIETAKITDGERAYLKELLNQNNALRQKSNAVNQAVTAMQQEAAALGKSNAELKLHELRLQGATAAQLRQAQAALAQVKAHERLSRLNFANMGAMAQMAMGAIGIGSAAGVMRLADDWTILNNRLKLVTQSSQELKAAQDGLFNISMKTGQSLNETAQVYQRIAANQKALKLSTKDVLDITETINQAVVVGGSSAQGAAAALMQFGQAMASGVLRGEEFNSVMEQAPGLAQALASGLGVGVGQLRAMANNGELTAIRVTQALKKASEGVAADFAKMDLTIAQSANNFKTALTKFVGTSGQSSGAAKALGGAIRWAAEHIDLLAAGVSALIGLALARWLVMGTASLVQMTAAAVLLTKSSAAAAGANTVLAASIGRVGVVSALAGFQVTSLSGSLAVLRAAAGAAIASPFGLFAAGLASVSLGLTGLEAALRTFEGRDAGNWISDGFDGILDKLGLIDSRVETLGTKLHDLSQKPMSLTERLQSMTGPMGSLVVLGKRWYDSLNDAGRQLEKTKALIQSVQWAQGYVSADEKIARAGSAQAYKAQNMGFDELKKSLSETVVKYREQADAVGKSSIELEKLRLAAEKTALLEKQKQKFEEEYANEANRDDLVRQSMQKAAAQIERDFQAASRAMDDAERATKMHTAAQNAQTEALQRAKRVQDGIAGLYDELERVGKSAQELRLMDLQKAGATAEQLAQAKALLEAIDAKEKAFEATQNKFDNAGSSFQAAADDMKLAADKMHGSDLAAAKRLSETKEPEQESGGIEFFSPKTTIRQPVGASDDGRIRESFEQLRQALKESGSGVAKTQQQYNTDALKAYQEHSKRLSELLKQQAANGKNPDQAQNLPAIQQQLTAAQNLNGASENLDMAAKAVQAAAIMPQAQPTQPMQDMGRITLDLRAPDGKTLTGILFGNKEFLAKFKSTAYQSINSYIDEMHAALT